VLPAAAAARGGQRRRLAGWSKPFLVPSDGNSVVPMLAPVTVALPREMPRLTQSSHLNRSDGQSHAMTAHRPREKLRSQRPILHCCGCTPVWQKDSQCRTGGASEFAIDLVERRDRQFRAVRKPIVLKSAQRG
jgi:hypothetical protein